MTDNLLKTDLSRRLGSLALAAFAALTAYSQASAYGHIQRRLSQSGLDFAGITRLNYVVDSVVTIIALLFWALAIQRLWVGRADSWKPIALGFIAIHSSGMISTILVLLDAS